MYRRSSESQIRSGTSRGVSKWSRRKDRYIGRLFSDFGKVPSELGIFRSTGELREFAGENYWALLGHTGIEERCQKEGGAEPPLWSELDKGGSPLFLLPLLLFSSPTSKGGVLLLLFPSPTRKGGVLLPVGVGLPPWRASSLGRPPPPLLLYIRGRGDTPKTQQLIS